MGNLGTLAIGALLIIGILFLGYKMDTSSSKSKGGLRKKEKESPFREENIEDYDEDDIYPSKISSDILEEKKSKKSKKSKGKHQKYFYDDVKEDEEESYEADNYETENYDEEYYDDYAENNEIDASDLVENNKYEEEDFEFFSSNDDLESTFNDDIDNNIDYELEEKEPVQDYSLEDFSSQEVEPEVVAEPEVVEPEFVEPEVEEVVAPKPKKRGRPKKNAKVEVEEKPAEEPEEDFSSTMIFNTDKIYGTLEELDEIDKKPVEMPSVKEEEPEEDYSAAVNIDIDALEDDASSIAEGPIKPEVDDAESFMNELKRLQETAEADEFSGFVVDNKDKELKEVHKKYTKKKMDTIIDDTPQISFIPEVEEPEEIIPSSSGMDMSFLEQMEKNLKETQKARLNKSKTSKRKKED